MIAKKSLISTLATIFLMVCFLGTAELAAGSRDSIEVNPVADVSIGSSGINWQPKVNYASLVLTVSRPDGSVFSKTFNAGITPYFDLSESDGVPFTDGTYTYELRVVPVSDKKVRKPGEASAPPQKVLAQTGYFSVLGGSVVPASGDEDGNTPLDYLIYDDLIVTGSLCVGFDCADGESFGFDTIILKEHNLRIFFNDTSYTASYPTNSWRITINDSTNGGGSYFSVDDADDGTSPFRIEAGSPSYSLYVDDYGRVGFGTSTPVVELHVKDSDTPTLRLEQDSSGGWTAQTWDVAGNESNFFVRDATNGSKLPFRIQPSTPSSTLCLKSDGSVGMGTWSPEANLEIEGTNSSVKLIVDRTDGSTAEILAKANNTSFGSKSDHPVQFTVNSSTKMTIGTNGYVGISTSSPSYPLDMGTIAPGAYCTTGGVWHDASSLEYKENIRDLSTEDALDAFNRLQPVRYYYKVDKEDEYVGFIAEHVPELVASKDRKGMSSMNIVAVLTKVLQQQQESMQQQQQTISDLLQRISQLEKKLK